MIKKRKRVYKAPSADEFAEKMLFQNPAVSSSEFTGMTPTDPLTEDEAESICELMGGVPVSSEDGAQVCKRTE